VSKSPNSPSRESQLLLSLKLPSILKNSPKPLLIKVPSHTWLLLSLTPMPSSSVMFANAFLKLPSTPLISLKSLSKLRFSPESSTASKILTFRSVKTLPLAFVKLLNKPLSSPNLLSTLVVQLQPLITSVNQREMPVSLVS